VGRAGVKSAPTAFFFVYVRPTTLSMLNDSFEAAYGLGQSEDDGPRLLDGELTLMTQIYRRPFEIGRESRTGGQLRRDRHQVAPVLSEELERRALLSVVNLTASVSPMIIRQINPMNQPHAVQVAVIRPVTLAGYVTETTGALPKIRFQVVDQNGRHMPSGAITPQFVAASTPGPPNLFFFSFRFGLNRSRPPGQPAREYTVFVTAQDPQGSSTIAIPVTTPSHRR
jgi:hypothetical protein